MRIRRCASRLLGSASAPPQSELPPPPPAHESPADFVAASGTSYSSGEPCELSLSPWDLMDQLDLSDPQEEELFVKAYFISVAWRASWLFQPSTPAGSIKEEEQEDMVDGVIFELRVTKKTAAKKSRPKTKKWKAKAEAEECDTEGGGGEPVWICKKNDGKRWFCRRPVSQPNSFCLYHSSDQKPPSSSKQPRKRAAAYAGEGFYYYAGFGPSRSKRHRISSSGDGVLEPPPAGHKNEALPDPEEHIGLTTVQAKADGADHQPAAPVHVDDEPRCDGMAGIAGCDEESSDDDVVGIKRKIPLKKRWRKPVKARSLKSLMY